jgi:hypothetical protein
LNTATALAGLRQANDHLSALTTCPGSAPMALMTPLLSALNSV